jgi:inner membrane protein COX18
MALRPIIEAQKRLMQLKIIEEEKTAKRGPEKATKELASRVKEFQKNLLKRHGIPFYPIVLPWLQLPIWLLVIETIRKMCGTHDGLLGLATRSFTGSKTEEPLVSSPILESVGLPNLELDMTQSGTSPASEKIAAILPSSDTAAIPVVESLGTEGTLWFPNLLISDPQLILPVVLGGVLFSNIHYQERMNLQKGIEHSKWTLRFTRALKVVALVAIPGTMHLPAAMHVYWISSSFLAFLQNVGFERFLPSTKVVKPCKPPIAYYARNPAEDDEAKAKAKRTRFG